MRCPSANFTCTHTNTLTPSALGSSRFCSPGVSAAPDGDLVMQGLSEGDQILYEHRAARGGRRQRAAAWAELAQDASPTKAFDSQLGLHLLKEWTWGHKSAIEVQRLAALALADQRDALNNAQGQRALPLSGHTSQMLEALAGLGNSGRIGGNCHRDLLRFMGEPKYPKPLMAPVSVKVQKPKRFQPSEVSVELPFLLPHEYFAFLASEHPSTFASQFLGDVDGSGSKLEYFWRGVSSRRDPRLARHPMTSRADWLSHAVPLSLHGDAVPCVQVGKHATKSYDAISFQALFAEGTSLAVKNLVFGIFEHSKGPSTMEDVWKVIVWSFDVLFQGVWPSKDFSGRKYPRGSSEHTFAGTPLAKGLFGVLWVLRRPRLLCKESVPSALPGGNPM